MSCSNSKAKTISNCVALLVGLALVGCNPISEESSYESEHSPGYTASPSGASGPSDPAAATRPRVSGVSVSSGLEVDVTFNEAMGVGVATPGNYTVSGSGKGALAAHPNSVALVAGNTYRLTWNSGEMRAGGDITITVVGVSDVEGNEIGIQNSGTDSGAGIGVAPTVSGVTARNANGAYGVGATVTIDVEFSESVVVNTAGGTPYITLKMDGADRNAAYTGGSSTNTLTFAYTVQAGDANGDLDYSSTTALSSNSGSISDAAGNLADLDLPAAGGPGSISDNQAVVIETTAPTVLSVASTSANGGYVTGETVTIQATFSEPVIVNTTGGTPYLTLETGATDRNASYSSGTTTDTLTFSYAIQSGDVSGDLDYNSTTALKTNLGTIKDAAGNDASLDLPVAGDPGSISASHAIVVCAQSTYSGLGSGSRTDPYVICTPEQLASLGASSAGWRFNYKQMHNIDLAGYTQVADGTRWIPIGNTTTKFTGAYDGNRKSITNFTYTDTTAGGDYLGIFGYISGNRAIVKNLNVANVAINGRNYVGAIVGYCVGCKIINSSSSGNLDGVSYMGGIAGYATSGALLGSLSSTVNIRPNNGVGGGAGAGGITGYLGVGSVMGDSHYSGTVKGGQGTGGVVGTMSFSVLANCYANATVASNNQYTGGIAGTSNNNKVFNSFFTGTVTGSSAVANVVGITVGSGTSTNSYYSSVSSCTNSAGGACNPTGTSVDIGASPNYFHSSANAPMSSWDFGSAWQQNAGAYPTLRPGFDWSAWGECGAHLADAPFAGGTGAVAYPYLICTPAQLNAIGSLTSNWAHKNYLLMADIDMSAYTGKQYNIIGTSANPFRGSFDGNGRLISNFTWSNSLDNTGINVGLIGYIDSGVIKNLGMTGVSMLARQYIGGIAGSAVRGSAISDVFVQGQITGQDGWVGGIVGAQDYYVPVQSSYTAINASGVRYIGGVAGVLNGSITNVFVDGNVSVTAGQSAGPVYGFVNGSSSEIYYNSSVARSCTNCTNFDGTGVDVGGAAPATYFYDKTKAPLSTWDFETVWLENGASHPTLRP